MYEEICYEKSFLKQVVARVDFVSPNPAMEKTLPNLLARSFSALFPIVEPPQDNMSYEIQLNAGSPIQTQKPFKQWNFFGKDREKQLSISSQFFFIIYNRYSSFEDLRGDFGTVANLLNRAYPEMTVSRFGLRYINMLEDLEGMESPTSWNDYISPALLGATAFFPADKLARLVHIAETKCGDMNLRFQYGMPNPDYPAVMKRASFVLDLDATIQTAHEIPQSVTYLNQAHGCIQELFERSITDKLREMMSVRTAQPSV